MEKGIEQGLIQGLEKSRAILALYSNGKNCEEISAALQLPINAVQGVLVYEEREKVARDHQWMMDGAIEMGMEQGVQEGLQMAKQIFKLHAAGKSIEEIAIELNLTTQQVKTVL